MSETSANLALPYLQPSQAQKHVTHNEALLRLDLLTQLTVESFGATVPPDLPQEGRIWALGPQPAGGWAGQGDTLAAWVDGAWLFIDPQPGWRAWSRGDDAFRIRTATGWAPPAAPLPETDNLPGLGINTAHDTTNRLAVAAPATLLSHQGGDHRLKINKAATGDTASLLFQTGWSGQVEMGTAGSDDFSVRVSPDGSTWHSALNTDQGSGRVTLPNGLTVTGALTLPAGSVTRTALAGGTALSLLGRAANSAGAVADIAAASNHQVMRRSGTAIGFGAIALNQGAAVSGQLPVAHGGTGAATASAARDNLDLGTAAVADVTTSATDTTAGRVLRVGDWGLGDLSAPPASGGDLENVNSNRFISGNGSNDANAPPGSTNQYQAVSLSANVNNNAIFGYFRGVNAWYGKSKASGAWGSWVKFWTSGNTTVDTNGFVKEASPILRLAPDGLTEPADPVGATFERAGAGHYRISNTSGPAQKGWQIELPRDPNGNLMVAIDTDWSDNVLTVLVGAPVWENGRIIRGDLMDIPTGRWIDLRMQSPEVAQAANTEHAKE